MLIDTLKASCIIACVYAFTLFLISCENKTGIDNPDVADMYVKAFLDSGEPVDLDANDSLARYACAVDYTCWVEHNPFTGDDVERCGPGNLEIERGLLPNDAWVRDGAQYATCAIYTTCTRKDEDFATQTKVFGENETIMLYGDPGCIDGVPDASRYPVAHYASDWVDDATGLRWSAISFDDLCMYYPGQNVCTAYIDDPMSIACDLDIDGDGSADRCYVIDDGPSELQELWYACVERLYSIGNSRQTSEAVCCSDFPEDELDAECNR